MKLDKTHLPILKNFFTNNKKIYVGKNTNDRCVINYNNTEDKFFIYSEDRQLLYNKIKPDEFVEISNGSIVRNNYTNLIKDIETIIKLNKIANS